MWVCFALGLIIYVASAGAWRWRRKKHQSKGFGEECKNEMVLKGLMWWLLRSEDDEVRRISGANPLMGVIWFWLGCLWQNATDIYIQKKRRFLWLFITYLIIFCSMFCYLVQCLLNMGDDLYIYDINDVVLKDVILQNIDFNVDCVTKVY